jgi:hypothetical protein
MRSDLVHGAIARIASRYHLCHLVCKGARKFHRLDTRLQDTTNDILVRLASSWQDEGAPAGLAAHLRPSEGHTCGHSSIARKR